VSNVGGKPPNLRRWGGCDKKTTKDKQ